MDAAPPVVTRAKASESAVCPDWAPPLLNPEPQSSRVSRGALFLPPVLLLLGFK